MKGVWAVLCLFNTGWLSQSLTVHAGIGLSPARVAQSSQAVHTGVCSCAQSAGAQAQLDDSTSTAGTGSMLKWR